MLTIRATQIETLRQAVREPMHRRILAFIKQNLPEKVEGLGDEIVLRRIADADRKATGYGIRTERGITQFVALTFLIDPKFDEIPRIKDFLGLPEPDPDLKIRWFVKALAYYKRETDQPGPGGRLVEGIKTAFGLIIALVTSPFVLFSVGTATMGPAALEAAAGAGEALVLLGEGALAALSSPVVLGVLAVAVVAAG
ncbi:MAG TPA: hypothetical protein VFT74_03635, partial [Isosphaeraceae bacterium]|nr:hypothetical protein [Isosphaeraceae bacterium]